MFVRYRRVDAQWRDLDVKQTRLNMHMFSTAQTLLAVAAEKWALKPTPEEDELLLRLFDKEFGEYIDLEEEPAELPLQHLAKYELIHRRRRCGPDSEETGDAQEGRKAEQVASAEQLHQAGGSSSRDTPSSTRSSTPPPAALLAHPKDEPSIVSVLCIKKWCSFSKKLNLKMMLKIPRCSLLMLRDFLTFSD